MVRITLNNNKGHLTGDVVQLNALREGLKIRHPQAFYIKQKVSRQWDGFVHAVTDSGYFKTGIFPIITKWLRDNNIPFVLTDTRVPLRVDKMSFRIGTYELHPHQKAAVESVLYNKVEGITFQRGIINAATNAGKTLMIMSMYKSLDGVKGILLLNNGELYNQFMQDMPKYFDKRDWGYMRGKEIKLADFMVVMVQTLVNNLKKYENWLSQVEAVFVDECDLSTNKTYTKIIEKLYNSTLRVGLTGSVFLSTLKKDALKNREIQYFLGPELYKIKNEELIQKKISTPVVVKLNEGNLRVFRGGNYDEEYRQGITVNLDRHLKIYNRVEYYLKQEFKPILIMCQYHEHVESLFNFIKIRIGANYKLTYIHGDVPERNQRLERFKDGKIDVLISSMIIKRGQNIPMTQVIINAAGGDSAENVLQILGRGTRKHENKTRTYYDDFIDMGTHLQKHSRHRMIVYKNEHFKVINNCLRKK